MKKITLLKLFLLLFLSVNNSFAQEGANQNIFSINLRYATQTLSSKQEIRQNNLSWSVTPAFAWRKKEHLLMGIGIGVDIFRYKSNSDYPLSLASSGYSYSALSRSQGFSPFFFLAYDRNINDKFSWVLRTAIQYEFYNLTFLSRRFSAGVQQESTNANKRHSYMFFIEPTFRYQLFKKWGIQLTTGRVNFRHSFKNTNDDPDSFSFYMTMRWAQWRVGFFRHFGAP